MQRFEYHVVPAPRRGEKARGVKTTEERFALALSTLMNQLGAEGWDYVRADALPCDERAGFTGTKTTFQNVLVFRRPLRALGADVPEQPAMRLFNPEPAAAGPKLGPAETPIGPAPAVGPAKGVAAE
ncbi:MAG: DUF4177 domain-containing protein [Tabrizicola sp.]|uniref:DUF4177 domain-containing protein n=1 Tax=Tabrizicola sp. TaxID=2005166 RepID=UPI0027351563|nr:DUF4177 domain-containing protein [Tabrizicola sp.]MDP3264124.1 DUF4177 domain-containing protein [Tabrizicola sp.]MDP3648753.1 DUF4177 domain-containing protein [Paracoccaceae bacterium]MDZ4068943.1 DUF4177 domain-containing protein [Tabrizicola sp.]